MPNTTQGKARQVLKPPSMISICNLEVVAMPNGEVISKGRTLGFVKDFKGFLTFQAPTLLAERAKREGGE